VAHPVQVEGLRKNYGDIAALKGVDFEVRAGEAFGLLGLPGAGKTTTLEILVGLRPRTGGRVTVLGCDPAVQSRQLKDRVGVCLATTDLQPKIKVREVLELFASLYPRTLDRAQLLKRLQLWEQRDAPYSRLSAAQRQRLALALALLNDPQVLFLDEPSTGLDAQARREIHGLIEDLRREPRTILLTTGCPEEAAKLCGRVAILDEGRIAAIGTPREIRDRLPANSVIEMKCAQPLADGPLPQWVGAERTALDERRTRVTVISGRSARTMVEMIRWMEEKGIPLVDVRIKEPSLGDAFLGITGKSLPE